jgi:DNA-binding CsgD family transcriptional regulator
MQHSPSERAEQNTELAVVWQQLSEGRLFIRDSYCESGRCYAAFEVRTAPLRPSSLKLRVLERLFQGEGQKSVAADMRVSVASVAGYSTNALSSIACAHRVSRAPIMLVMASLAARGTSSGRVRHEGWREDGTWLVSVEIPGETFRERLSSSEAEVVRLSIEGEPHASIAQLRGTSIRTVANQLASAFNKLKVSGRSSLRALAVREHAARLRTTAPSAPSVRPVAQLPPPSFRNLAVLERSPIAV